MVMLVLSRRHWLHLCLLLSVDKAQPQQRSGYELQAVNEKDWRERFTDIWSCSEKGPLFIFCLVSVRW